MRRLMHEAESEYERLVAKAGRVGKLVGAIAEKGSLSQRVSALVVQLAAPGQFVYRLEQLEQLTNIAKEKSRRSQEAAGAALRDLYLGGAIPRDRKLLNFMEQSFARLPEVGTPERSLVLSYWYLEHFVKKYYGELVDIIRQGAMQDGLPIHRKFFINLAVTLLKAIPEQEIQLLEIMVNKLGDTTRHLAVLAFHLLARLLPEHPVMQEAIVREVEHLIFQKNRSTPNGTYFGVLLLGKVRVSQHNQKLVKHLMKIYFDLFELLIKKGDVESAAMRPLLQGLRIVLWKSPDSQRLEAIRTHQAELFTLAASATFVCRVLALSLLFYAVECKDEALTTRFYNSLYRLLAAPQDEMPSTKHGLTVFFTLVFKAIRATTDNETVCGLIHRLVQGCCLYNSKPGLPAAALVMLKEVASTNPVVARLATTAYADLRSMAIKERDAAGNTDPRRTDEYTPGVRTVSCSGGTFEPLWTLGPLMNHFHPAVVELATCVAQDAPVRAASDPLESFTVGHFLDSFVDEKPKAKLKAQLRGKVKASLRRFTNQLRTLPPSEVELHEVFARRFFVEKHKRDKLALTVQREIQALNKHRASITFEDSAIPEDDEEEVAADDDIDGFDPTKGTIKTAADVEDVTHFAAMLEDKEDLKAKGKKKKKGKKGRKSNDDSSDDEPPVKRRRSSAVKKPGNLGKKPRKS
eukprot:TRINITY_DN2150_c0_g1_i1.p1 TRINITY_DN2150_c0_g1~~TRINITY_DN2150_c0_g1_i1.p1  ORF type:complete len:730 (+),score=124.68 TRINITY_DN2150_c0_g1_i1:121-2190(+)